MRWFLMAPLLLLLLGCRATPAKDPSSGAAAGHAGSAPEEVGASQPPATAASAQLEASTTPNERMERSSPDSQAGEPRTAAADHDGRAPGAEADEPSAQAQSLDKEARGRALPKLSLKVVGLHVGGGPNNASTRSAFEAPLLRRSSVLMACYRHVDVPRQHVLFGADVLIPRDGGRARVRKVRTKVTSARFSDCLRSELERVPFTSPLGRATTVSYSLRFSLVGLESPSARRGKQAR